MSNTLVSEVRVRFVGYCSTCNAEGAVCASRKEAAADLARHISEDHHPNPHEAQGGESL
jgi:hypothetical protein